MGLTASQIRQDFNCFGNFGQQGYGYNVRELRGGIAEALGAEDDRTAVVVGAGNLGRALIANFRFGECGCRLAAAFDVSPALAGRSIAGTPVLPAGELERFVRENGVDVAVLTVPKGAAAEVAARLAACGVRGIWNFTGADVEAPGAVVENVHFTDSLQALMYYLRNGAEG